MLDPAFDTPERTGFDAHARPRADGGSQPHLQVLVQGEKDLLQLSLQRRLIEHFEEIGHMVALQDRILSTGLHLQEDVTGKEGLAKHHGFSPVFMGQIVAGQRGGNPLPRAVFHQLLLPARSGMRDEPK